MTSTAMALAPRTPAIFLMGATACGKTAVSVELAKKINAEIISVDSVLVYRGMDIGTAKPDVQERGGVVHHLIDICEPWQSYSAAQFAADANALIEQIHQRGKRALLVGGTMLYFKALEEGLANMPEADETIRASISLEAQAKGWQALHKRLAEIDPQAATRIHPNDPQRLQRALEVYQITGVPLSELQARTHSKLTAAPIKFSLQPVDRSWLHARIETRFDQMLAAGFVNELKQLHANDRLHIDLPSVRSVGYRQGWELLDTLGKGVDVNETMKSNLQWREKAIAATRQLAKRQLTWLRSMQNVTAIECDTQPLDKQLHCLIEAITKQAHSTIK